MFFSTAKNPAEHDLNAWLYHFETLHSHSIDMGLSRISTVWDIIKKQLNIQRIAKTVISVSGTNGKGSTCQMLALLTQPKHRIAIYSSPHLHSPNERISINQKNVSDEQLIYAFQIIESSRGEITLSYFEAFTLAAFIIIYQSNIDIAILEVGLGGRLDAVNSINADACIVSSISKDHENFLGSDLQQIAREKLGISRKNKFCIYGDQNIDTIIYNECINKGIRILCNSSDYQIVDNNISYRDTQFILPSSLKLQGSHQLRNAATAILLLHQLNLLPYNYTELLSSFSLMGRMQCISQSPDIFLDVAHNIGAAQSLFESVNAIKPRYHPTVAIIAMLYDKDHTSVLETSVTIFDHLIITSTQGERGYSAEELATKLPKNLNQQHSITVEENIDDALNKAKKLSGKNGVIVAYGSFQIVTYYNAILTT